MGRVFAPAVPVVIESEAVKKTKISCPYPKWTPGLFDPDSDEFFTDFIDERCINSPSPVSSLSTASTPSEPSSPGSLASSTVAEDSSPLETLIQSVRADVDSLTWLSRVPSDAHVVPDARGMQADVAEQPAATRSRSISDAANRHRLHPWRSPRRTAVEVDVEWLEEARSDDAIDEQIGRPITPPPPPSESLFLPSTPPRSATRPSLQTPASSVYTISPPPSVTPRMLAYDHITRRSYPSVPASPTLPRPPRTQRMQALPAF